LPQDRHRVELKPRDGGFLAIGVARIEVVLCDQDKTHKPSQSVTHAVAPDIDALVKVYGDLQSTGAAVVGVE